MRINNVLILFFCLFTFQGFSQGLNWVNQFNTTHKIGGADIKRDNLGNVYSAGSFQGTIDMDPGPGTYNFTSVTINEADSYIAKFDSLGNFVWGRKIGGISNDVISSMTLDKNGNIYCTGHFSKTVDFDPG